MKVTPSKFLQCTLYTVLICMPPMLSAAEVTRPIHDVQSTAPRQHDGEAKAENHHQRLSPDQLDSVGAGQVVLPPLPEVVLPEVPLPEAPLPEAPLPEVVLPELPL
jgi:hypothetical protein